MIQAAFSHVQKSNHSECQLADARGHRRRRPTSPAAVDRSRVRMQPEQSQSQTSEVHVVRQQAVTSYPTSQSLHIHSQALAPPCDLESRRPPSVVHSHPPFFAFSFRQYVTNRRRGAHRRHA